MCAASGNYATFCFSVFPPRTPPGLLPAAAAAPAAGRRASDAGVVSRGLWESESTIFCSSKVSSINNQQRGVEGR